MNEEMLLEEFFGIFEEDGQLFIESEMVEYVMDTYDLYEEDAIEVIMEAYEEELDALNNELDSLLEAVDILVEEYGIDEDEAIDMVLESETYAVGPALDRPDEDTGSARQAMLGNAGRGALAGATVAGLGYGALRLKHRYDHNKDIRSRRRQHKKQMSNIKKTGKRLEEASIPQSAKDYAEPFMPKDSAHLSKGQRNAAYGAGVAVGALGTGALALYSRRRDKKRHAKIMRNLDRKYQRKEERAKERYMRKHPEVKPELRGETKND